MSLGLPFEPLHEALASAIHKDLPEIKHWVRDWSAWKKLPKEEQVKFRNISEGPGEWQYRRPCSYDNIEVIMFPQTWGSTALGYGGMGGASMTPAYTVIVSMHQTYCVYFGGGRLAYKVETKQKQSHEGRNRFFTDIAQQNMAHCGEEGRYI